MLAVAVARLLTLPRGFWEGEEIRFAQALLTFDPFRSQPEPPGYPLYVALGRLVNVFVRDPFASLVALSVIASIAGAYLVARFAGPAAAIFLFLSPALLVFGPLPDAESVSLALIAATFFFLQREQPELFALCAAASIGCRPQIAPAMLVVFAIGYVVLPRRARMLSLFFISLTACFVPLLEAVSVGWAKTSYQSMRLASDAVGAQGKELLMRFIAHPWGSKFLALPVLAMAAIGVALAGGRLGRRPTGVSPVDDSGAEGRRAAAGGTPALLAFAVVHLGFAFAFLDRSDGVQPVIPALLPIAVFAAWPPRGATVLAAIYAVASVVYTMPLLQARRTISPPMQAVQSIPRDAVVLYEPSLEAHVKGRPVAEFGDFVESPAPLFVLADGGSPYGRTFSWPDSDAYGKITTERYRVVSAIPFPPARRYRPRAGVYAFERTAGGEEWRWLAKEAVIDLPRAGQAVALSFGLPNDSPVESNAVTVNGRRVEVRRGERAEIEVPWAPRLMIRSDRSFSGPGETRDLAVQMLSLEQR